MKVTIMYKNSFVGGDGWKSYPIIIEINDNCPICGEKRGRPQNKHFYEDGEWFDIHVWENNCGHLDKYDECYNESLKILKITPPHIKKLFNNEIFVFGSNESGIHGAGAAKLAVTNWGAIIGQPEGLQGKTYAIPTKDKLVKTALNIDQIKKYVDNFINFAESNKQLIFLVTEIGCGLSKLNPKDIAPLFINVKKNNIQNICLPQKFWDKL